MIALLCPSKGRPDKLKRMWESAKATAMYPDKLELFIAINEEEKNIYTGYVDAQMLLCKDWSIVLSNNLMAEMAMKKHPLIMMIGDDTIFSTIGWDLALMEAYDKLDKKEHVFALLDSRDAEGTPHPIVTREWLDVVGYLACPIFLHWYVDSWLTDMAKHVNRFTHLKDYLLVHDKPSDTSGGDLTHTSIRDRGWNIRDKYVADKLKGTFYVMECQRLRSRLNG